MKSTTRHSRSSALTARARGPALRGVANFCCRQQRHVDATLRPQESTSNGFSRLVLWMWSRTSGLCRVKSPAEEHLPKSPGAPYQLCGRRCGHLGMTGAIFQVLTIYIGNPCRTDLINQELGRWEMMNFWKLFRAIDMPPAEIEDLVEKVKFDMTDSSMRFCFPL